MSSLKRNFFQRQTIKIRHIWRQLTNNKHYSTAYLFLSFSKVKICLSKGLCSPLNKRNMPWNSHYRNEIIVILLRLLLNSQTFFLKHGTYVRLVSIIRIRPPVLQMRGKKNALNITAKRVVRYLIQIHAPHCIARTRQVLSGYPISKPSYPGAALHMPTTA